MMASLGIPRDGTRDSVGRVVRLLAPSAEFGHFCRNSAGAEDVSIDDRTGLVSLRSTHFMGKVEEHGGDIRKAQR